MKRELAVVFGNEINFDVATGSPSSPSNLHVVIALAVLLAVSLLGLIIAVVFVVR